MSFGPTTFSCRYLICVICKQKLFEQSFVKFLNACQMSNIRDTRACSMALYISMKLSCITFQIVPHLIEALQLF